MSHTFAQITQFGVHVIFCGAYFVSAFSQWLLFYTTVIYMLFCSSRKRTSLCLTFAHILLYLFYFCRGLIVSILFISFEMSSSPSVFALRNTTVSRLTPGSLHGMLPPPFVPAVRAHCSVCRYFTEEGEAQQQRIPLHPAQRNAL